MEENLKQSISSHEREDENQSSKKEIKKWMLKYKHALRYHKLSPKCHMLTNRNYSIKLVMKEEDKAQTNYEYN